MSPLFKWIGIWIISMSTESVYVTATHAVVGNYSQLNLNDCGINRFSHNLNDMCFKWHKNWFSGILGRKVINNEVPWMAHVLLVKWTILKDPIDNSTSEFWALGGSKNRTVVIVFDRDPIPDRVTDLSKYSIPIEIHIHPTYNAATNNWLEIAVDLALLKIVRPNNTRLKSICLPKSHIINEKREYAFNSGWGRNKKQKEPLQMGYKMIVIPDDVNDIKYPPDLNVTEAIKYMRVYIMTLRVDNQAMSCMGDSGGPLWQYYNGRAVLIGVFSALTDPRTGICDNTTDPEPGISFFKRVSDYIDWIKNVTQLN